jgi:hypothetical protein
MTTDFDSKAFSAVSSFFGSRQTADGGEKDAKLEPIRKHRDRSGVGATRDSSDEQRDELLDDRKARDKILSIGSKRRRQDESEDEEGKDSYIDDDDDEDGEGGRTSIRKKIIQPDPPDIGLTKKTKKKKGKKERKAEKNAQAYPEKNLVEVLNPEMQNTSDETNQTNAESELSAEGANKTKKRRKVRSKQKNIRKDTRPSSQKPEHLRIGAKTFAGRPITKETREYLNLPESRSLALRRQRENNKNNSQKSQSLLGDGNLVVDDLLKESFNTSSMNTNTLDHFDEIPDSGQVISRADVTLEENMNSNQPKQRSRKKKIKFKNLR